MAPAKERITIRHSLPYLFVRSLPQFVIALFLYATTYQLLKFTHTETQASITELNTMYRVVLLVILSGIALQYFNEFIIFSARSATHFDGFLNTRLKRSTLAYRHIREVRVEQTILGRTLGYGTLLIGTASTDSHEISMPGISRVDEVATLLLNERTDRAVRTDVPSPLILPGQSEPLIVVPSFSQLKELSSAMFPLHEPVSHDFAAVSEELLSASARRTERENF